MMAERVHLCALFAFIWIYIFTECSGQVLTPPTFNLAKGRKIQATATCGYGVSKPELYCKMTGSIETEKDDDSGTVIQGQICDYCDPNRPRQNHSADKAIDGTEHWWQSPPLSRGDMFNQVNLTIDLEQEFHIAYIIIKMANSPRPGVWALEKSSDNGLTWEPWQYFADTPADCMRFFSTEVRTYPTRDNEVLCVTEFSRIVPLEYGEIFVSLTNGRPNSQNFSYADDLKTFIKATNVRLRLIRARTLSGHLMAVANQDPTVTRRYYYSIKDISLGGRCVCNGHADTCNYLDPNMPDKLICDCQHNTVGEQCQMCDAANGFVQKKWQPARTFPAFECEPCECYGRATGCVYDPEVDLKGLSIDIHGFYKGGGVCQNCGYNTTGINCEKCLDGFYRPYGVPRSRLAMCMECQCNPRFHINKCEEETGRCLCREEYTGYDCDSCAIGYYGYPNCIPCDCDVNGTEGNICHVNGGQCPCKENYVGAKCDMCQLGFYNFPECRACECGVIGSDDDYCDVEDGQCKCRMNYASRNCSECSHGYFNYPDCTLCNCDHTGALEEVCDKSTGSCLCKETFNGAQCDQCARGFYSYPDCMPCQCREPGSTSNICEDRNGQCSCRTNYAGQNCDRCAPGFYRYPDCIPCECDQYGSRGASCDQETGQCDCFSNFAGIMCEKCREGLYNYPNCEKCNCNPNGAKEVPGYPLGGCGEVVIGRLCECKERVMGRICDTCKPGFWNLNRNNPLGCEECGCSPRGTLAGVNICDTNSGQCMCKVSVTGRVCDRCKEGYHRLTGENVFGCVECNCDIGGSVSPVCNQDSGQCPCKPRVQGKRCDQPIGRHFIPTLDQFKYEIEDGYTPEGNHIRYGYDERLFPNFSWRGYAVLSRVQPEVRVNIEINKPSLYRLLFRYVNLNEKSVNANITFTPLSMLDIQQGSQIAFGPTRNPAFTDGGNLGGQMSFVLNPGQWTVAIKADESVFLDYMILIPQAYYEATILQNIVYRPCLVPDDGGPCYHYAYPDVMDFPRVLGEEGFIPDGDKRLPVKLFPDQDVLGELDVKSMAVLDSNQKSFDLELYIPKKDRYVLILNYHSKANGTQYILFNITTTGDQATALLYNCQYSSLCRQVLLSLDEMEGVYDFDVGTVKISVTASDDVNAAIESIVAIPYSIWSIGYIRPSIVCIRINGVCVSSRYALPVGSVRVDFEDLPNDHLIATEYPPDIEDTDIGLIKLNESQNLIVLLGTARNSGPNKFVVHYYLPYEDGKVIPITMFANGQEYRGSFRPRFCPSRHGCRDLLFFDETGQTGVLNLQETDVKIVFNNTSGQQIWLDYLLIIPSGQYSPTDVMVLPVDNSRNFIEICLDDGYKIRTPISDFCEKSLFSLTTEFNNGAMECDCNIDGSLSFNCNPNGGQCQCRPNVIGRTCSACRVGFYGFPRCQPCNCPFGLCEQLTGQCICPPRVTGDRCDVCEAGSYGYDALIGCQECKCSPQGVIDGDRNCEETTGQCRCLPGIGGRKCDYCLAGFYSYPLCRECDCDRYGTVGDICNPDYGTCICKENVEGDRCDQCAMNTFNLEPTNPEGCTSCFCFGNTANCRESDLRWSSVIDMSGWNITNTVDGQLREARTTIAVLDALNKISNTSTSMYWKAPKPYLENKVKSYGGFLHYKIIFILPRNDSILTESLIEPDLILVGNHGDRVEHMSLVQPYDSSSTPMEVQLYEYNFKHADGRSVDREAFMMILKNLEALHIRASYYSLVQEVRLMEVELDVATENGTGEVAVSVEQCTCPRGYRGTSCEDCAMGYYRARTYPFLGTCVPCDCNGHATECDLHTGQCIDCKDNTQGAHCEQCLPGYIGDPSRGGCTICGCPLNVDSNNFADTCFNRPQGSGFLRQCNCHEGYTGTRCERCAPGYFGDPMTVGEMCRPCQCSGNINTLDPYACDFQTGECLLCENNTAGEQCERCVDWWYGDAVTAKDCSPCQCDQCGSLTCSSQRGECTCKPNVIGINCDACAPDTYGFHHCEGCIPCECGLASISSQCNHYNGTCMCQAGVTGNKCQSCINGYWNYNRFGCEKCDCEFDGAVTCDPLDGRCQCLPGVTGPKCDVCLDRWVLIPQQGCQECDTCIDNLLDDLDTLDIGIDEIKDGLQTVSIGIAAMKRLEVANQTVQMIQPQLIAVLDQSENITLDTAEATLKQLEMFVNQISKRSKGGMSDAEDVVMEAQKLNDNSDQATVVAASSQMKAEEAIMYINGVLRQINEGIKVTNIETYITMSEKIIADMRARNLSTQEERIKSDIKEAEMLLERVKLLMNAPKRQLGNINETDKGIDDVNRRLLDLQESSQLSERTTAKADNLISSLRGVVMPNIDVYIEDIKMGEDITMETLDQSQDLLNKSADSIAVAKAEFETLDRTSSMLLQAKAAMVQFNLVFENLTEAEAYLNKAKEHANMLEEQASILESVYTDTRVIAQNAVDAGRAYENIVKAIENARDAARVAFQDADSAAIKSIGVGESSQNYTQSSEELLIEAKLKFNNTQDELLKRLDEAKAGTMLVEGMNKDVRNAGNQIKQKVIAVPVGKTGVKAEEVRARGEMAGQKADNSRNKVKAILDDISKQVQKTVPLTNDMLNTRRDINNVKVQVNNVQKFSPDMLSLMDSLANKSEKVQALGKQVKMNIDELRKKIAIARDQANLIRVGLNFLGNTTVQLRTPRNVDQAGSYSEVSLFFKTQSENGLLLYVGSEMSGSNKPNQDYMSLEIENGQAVLKYDLNSGLVKVNHQHYVADGKWYKVIAKRIGKAGILTIEQDAQLGTLGTVTGMSKGTNTVMDLHPLTTKFYAGGLPVDANMISDEVTRNQFVGAIEDITFDDTPMGLWNFKEGENNYKGARERDILTQLVSNGFRFDGSGYVVLSTSQTGWKPAVKVQITMKFKTYAPNGLLFFASKNRDFISVELRDGLVLYQYDLGGGRVQITYGFKEVNDGNWHYVQVNRVNKTGMLFVDSEGVGPVDSPGSLTQLEVNDDISIGGYPGVILPVSDVTKLGFDGCIEDVSIQLNTWDLNENKEAKGVIPGCPDQISRIATYDVKKLSYIANPIDSIGRNFDITFKMKTTQNKALLLFVANNDQSAGFSVSLVDGKISVISDPGGEKLSLMSRVNTYNDGRWHYISVMKKGTLLEINIDDYEIVRTTGQGQKATLATTTPLYFGNADVNIPANLADATEQFGGCIADVTINGEFLNFAVLQPPRRPNIALAGCPIPDPEGPYDRDPLPTPPPVPVTTPTTLPTLPPGQCALDQAKPQELPAANQRGNYFGTYAVSRLEFAQLPENIRIKSVFSLDFRTTEADGVIFYFADSKHVDHMSLIMINGTIRYTFDCGTGVGLIRTAKTYNDGKWHSVSAGRNLKEGVLIVDEEQVGITESAGQARSINVRAPYYFGGVNVTDLNGKGIANLAGMSTNFVGCIANIKVGNEDIGLPPFSPGVVPCSNEKAQGYITEPGAYFHSQGGYIQQIDNFNVGRDLEVKVDIRPRSLDGTIFAVHGDKGDFAVLQMVEGEMWFSADNGDGSIVAKVIPAMNNKFCDGAWHSVTATKIKNVVTLKVDDLDPVTEVSKKSATSTDTNNPMYIGGLPKDIKKGVRANGAYRGCIRNLLVNGQRQYLANGVGFNDVALESCPAI